MNTYVEDFHRQLVLYKERYGNKHGVISWHVFWYLVRHWFGRVHDYERHGCGINIGFVLDGGIGDIVLAGAYVSSFIKKLDCEYKIFIFVTQPIESIKILLKNLNSNVEILDRKYLKKTNLDLLIRFSVQFPEIEFYREGYIKKRSSFLVNYVTAVCDFNAKYKHLFESENIFEQQIFLDILGLNRISGMDAARMVDLKSSESLNVTAPKTTILKNNKLSKDEFITFAYSLDINNTATQDIRLLPKDTLQKVLNNIKKQYPGYKIVQLGSKTLADFENVDVNLVGKTSFAELLNLLEASKLHIDSECGMVHLRHALCAKPSVVFHGPTSVSTKGYPENINIRSNVCNCACCEWLMGNNWQRFCIKTNSHIPACMQAISSDKVFEKIKGILG